MDDRAQILEEKESFSKAPSFWYKLDYSFEHLKGRAKI
jgi:hypothetical protein